MHTAILAQLLFAILASGTTSDQAPTCPADVYENNQRPATKVLLTSNQHFLTSSHQVEEPRRRAEPTGSFPEVSMGILQRFMNNSSAFVSARRDKAAALLSGILPAQLVSSGNTYRRASAMWVIVIVSCLGVCIIFCAIDYKLQHVGGLVKRNIEKEDQHYLGTDVLVKSCNASAMSGRLDLRDVVILNPPGYKSPYLLKAGRIFMDIDMGQLTRSCFNFGQLTLEKTVVSDVELMYETGLRTSNVQEVLNYLNYGSYDGSPIEVSRPVSAQLKVKAVGVQSKEVGEDAVWLTLQEVTLERVGVKVASSPVWGGGLQQIMHFEVADCHYEHFTGQMGEHSSKEAIKLIIKSILETAMYQRHAQPSQQAKLGMGCC